MRQKKTQWALAAVITAAVVSLGIWRLVQPHRTATQPPTTQDVTKQLERATPVGSSRKAVEIYLDSQLIPHSYIDDSNSPKERRIELALIRDTSKSSFVRGDIQIRFRFDESDRLLDYSVQQVFTGP
jgi:hypothetical protein